MCVGLVGMKLQSRLAELKYYVGAVPLNTSLTASSSQLSPIADEVLPAPGQMRGLIKSSARHDSVIRLIGARAIDACGLPAQRFRDMFLIRTLLEALTSFEKRGRRSFCFQRNGRRGVRLSVAKPCGVGRTVSQWGPKY